ncbi:MAG: hypothetical protein YYHSYBAR_002951 [Candidatus Fervidibacter sacchari]
MSLLGNQGVTSGWLVGRVSGQEIEQVVGQVNGQGKKQGKGQDKGQIVGQAWGQLVAGFLFSKQISGATENTLQWFKYILMVYQTFHQTRIHPLHPLTECSPTCVQKYLAWLLERGRKLVTLNAHYRVLHTFFRWLKEIGLVEENIVEKVKRPKPEAALPRTVTEEHFAAALRLLDPSKPQHIKYITILTLLFDTGARVSEVLGLRWGDIDFNQRLIVLRGKGRKERVVPFGRVVAGWLLKYLSLNPPAHQDDLVFKTSNNTPISKRNLLRFWHNLQKKAGLKPLPLHGLRHGFARAWLMSGGDAFSLQLILGHTDASMTKRYVTLWGSDLQKKHMLHSPVDRLLRR